MTAAADRPHPDFRPDLEGVRGVAILLVVLFHAGVPGFAGGFVGVDVFFVLSGFLITGAIARELAATGRVALADFWTRRAARLFPALYLVVAATLALAWVAWAPIDRAAVARTARAVALSGANVHFARESVHYFGSGNDPLLHSWSLGVEQQFYVVWPLLLLAAALLAGRRWEGEARGRRALLVALALAGAASLAASWVLTGAGSGWAFYGLPTRLWEFALGGALALAARPVSSRAEAALPIVGLALVTAAVAAYDAATPYPGLAALLPALGAAAIVAAGPGAAARGAGLVLSAGWLRALGRLSYAWYLWHWPLVSLGAVLDPGIGAAGKLAWSLLALGPAWLTERWVERPLRAGGAGGAGDDGASSWRPAAALAATLVVAGGAHLLAGAAARRAAAPDQRAFAAAREDRFAPDRCWRAAPAAACAFGDPAGTRTVALFGDSHAEHWLAGLDAAGKARGWKVVAFVRGGCPVADLAAVAGRRRDRACARWREASVRRILALRPDAVLLSSYDHYVPVSGRGERPYVSADEWRRGLRRTYARFAAAGVPAVAMRDTPDLAFDAPGCLSRRAARLPFAGDCTYDRAAASHPVARAAQAAAVRGLPVRVLDLNDRVCATARCSVARGGIVVFTDDDHLTASFTRSLAPVLGARLAAAVPGLAGR
jgi:peptidoglycan/LPS O-acetylase OafA/YrhL